MSLAKLAWLLALVFLLAGCDLVAQQYPYSGFNQNAAPTTGNSSSSQIYNSPTQVTGSQRGQYVWDTALQGLAMGGAIAGPYGAGGGLIIGLIAGLFTADAHYTQLNGQIQAEQDKDKDLDKKIEQELQRQRDLEAQLATGSGNPLQPSKADPPQSVPSSADTGIKRVALKEEPKVVASVSKKETPAVSPNSPFKNVEVKDINGDGAPDLWIYYNPLKSGEIVRQEEATHWDGRVDTWSYFKDGKLVRREIDTKAKGSADTVYYFENEKIVREERDENGTGNVSYRAIYQNGRRAKVEKDTHGLGKADLWIYYDASADGEIVLKEEQDLNGDGSVDLWAYYQNGRLVRRDVSAAGLDILSSREQLPTPAADPKQTFAPQPQLVKDLKGRI